MTTLTTLKQQFDEQTQKGKGDLAITEGNSASRQLTEFLITLPTQQIALSNVSSIINNEKQTLTITGSANDEWFIRGTENAVFHLSQITLIYMQVSGIFDATLNVEGTLTIGQTTVVVTGSLAENNQMNCQIKHPSPVNRIGLVETANLISHNQLAAYLPVGVDLFVGQVPLTAFNFSFGFVRSAITSFTFTSDLNLSWKIVGQLAALEKVGITLTSEHGFRKGAGFRTSIGGDIHAYLLIDQEYKVALALQGQYDWQIEIIPADGNILPALAVLAGLLGGESLQRSVENGLKALGLGAIAIDGVYLRVDLKVPALRSIAIQGHITVQEITFMIDAYLPNFEFHGRLSPKSPIHLKALINKYFMLTDSFPEINITALAIGAQPGIGKYSLDASIETTWELKIGDISLLFKQFDLQITKQINGTTGFIRGVLEFIGTDLYTSAEYLEIGGGWQFYCSTEKNQEMQIGVLIGKLALLFGDIPLPATLTELQIKYFHVSFNTQSKDFTFTCETKFPVNNKELDLLLTIKIEKVEKVEQQKDQYAKYFSGKLTVDGLEFSIIFDSKPDATTFIALYNDLNGKSKTLRNFVGVVYPNNPIPDSLTIVLKKALYVYVKAEKPKHLFGLEFAGGINLADIKLDDLPIPAGASQIVPNQNLELTFRLLAASQAFEQDEITRLGALLHDGIALPPSVITGASVQAFIKLDSQTKQLNLPVKANKAGLANSQNLNEGDVNPAKSISQVTAVDGSNIQWLAIQKTFGPVYFERVGLQVQGSEISAVLDASFTVSALKIALQGLTMTSPLTELKPTFSLQGLSIDFKTKELEIGGAFLRQQLQRKNQAGALENYTVYGGMAIIRTSKLTLSAIGSYTSVNGQPSLFIYAVLDYPIGGPAFFFVTGLSAAFGYNRKMLMPEIDDVDSFPLIRQARAANSAGLTKGNAEEQKSEMVTKLVELENYIPVESGQYFIGVGIHFTSFNIVDSVVLLNVQFGKQVEIDLLGSSELIAPAGSKMPVAKAKLNLKARYLPSEGFLSVMGKLTSDSYILSQDCHLTGGFAFYCWFKELTLPDGNKILAGDFVLTLGGYHPKYNPPAHYPQVPRLGFSWQVNEQLSIKGSAYFALTPHAIMAGGNLEALWHSGSVRAWFKAGFDFLISWQPYYYKAHAYVSIGASYTFEKWGITKTFSGELGADVHVEGPDFSLTAEVDYYIFSVRIEYNIHHVENSKTINWGTFQQAFLPAKGRVCSVNVLSGLLYQAANGNAVMNRKTPAFSINTVIPVNQFGETKTDLGRKAGILPMGVSPNDFDSQLSITIGYHEKDGKVTNVTSLFTFKQILKSVPVALWGKSGDIKPGDPNTATRLVQDTVMGFELQLEKQLTPGNSVLCTLSALDTNAQVGTTAQWEKWEDLPQDKIAASWELIKTADLGIPVLADVPSKRDELLQAIRMSAYRFDLSHQPENAPKL